MDQDKEQQACRRSLQCMMHHTATSVHYCDRFNGSSGTEHQGWWAMTIAKSHQHTFPSVSSCPAMVQIDTRCSPLQQERKCVFFHLNPRACQQHLQNNNHQQQKQDVKLVVIVDSSIWLFSHNKKIARQSTPLEKHPPRNWENLLTPSPTPRKTQALQYSQCH